MFHLYGLFIGIAIVVGWSVAERVDARVGRVAPWVIGLGVIGARLYHVIDFWDYYQNDLLLILKIWEGGLSIWGAIMGGLVGWWSARGDLAMLSAIVTGLPLAQAVGRIANGVNGEFGQLVWGVPWWGMEAGLDLVLFGLICLTKRQYRVICYLVGYGLIRLVLSPYR